MAEAGGGGMIHGSYATYQRERKHGEPCPDCRAAATAYHARWRKARRERDRMYLRAQTRALWALKRNHEEEFRVLNDEELRKAGWWQ